MVHILLVGDSHIPKRASGVADEIYTKIDNIITNTLFDYTFFTGDLIDAPEFMDFLNNKTKKEVFKVIGNMDYYGGNRHLPQSQNLKIALSGNEFISIGLIHGHQITPRGDHSQLEYLALENGYNILVSGHTHKEEIFLTRKGILLLNPGSITGAWSFVASGNYSFISMKIDEKFKEISVTLFQYNNTTKKFNESESLFRYVDRVINPKY
jgi:putative phosphoesterase